MEPGAGWAGSRSDGVTTCTWSMLVAATEVDLPPRIRVVRGCRPSGGRVAVVRHGGRSPVAVDARGTGGLALRQVHRSAKVLVGGLESRTLDGRLARIAVAGDRHVRSVVVLVDRFVDVRDHVVRQRVLIGALVEVTRLPLRSCTPPESATRRGCSCTSSRFRVVRQMVDPARVAETVDRVADVVVSRRRCCRRARVVLPTPADADPCPGHVGDLVVSDGCRVHPAGVDRRRYRSSPGPIRVIRLSLTVLPLATRARPRRLARGWVVEGVVLHCRVGELADHDAVCRRCRGRRCRSRCSCGCRGRSRVRWSPCW